MPLFDELLRLLEEVDRDALTSYPKVEQKCEAIDKLLQNQEEMVRVQDEIIQSLRADVDQLRGKAAKLDDYVSRWEKWRAENWDEPAGMTKSAVKLLAEKDAEIELLENQIGELFDSGARRQKAAEESIEALRAKNAQIEILRAEIEELRQMPSSTHDSLPEDRMKARKCECGYLNLEHESENDPGYFEFPVRCGRCGEPTRNAETVLVGDGPHFRITPKLLSKLAGEIGIQIGGIKLDPIKLEPLAIELNRVKLELTVGRERWALYRVQRRALAVGVLVLILVGSFPPWASVVNAQGIKNFIGYSWWFEPPAPHDVCCYIIDTGQLALELILTCIVILAVVIVLRWHGQTDE